MEKYYNDNINPEYVEQLLNDIRESKAGYIDIVEIVDAADYLFTDERISDAELLINHAERFHQDAPEIKHIKARILIENRKFAEAQVVLESIKKHFENDPLFHITYGYSYLKLHNVKKAIICFKQAVKIDGEIAYEIGMNLNQFCIFSEAKKFLAIYNELHPDDIDCLFELANAHAQLGQLNKAQKLFSKLLDINPLVATAWFNLGIIHSKNSDYKKAITCYENAISVNPEYDVPYFNLANAYFNINNYEKALEYYTEFASLTDHEQLISSLFQIAECWWQLANYEMAYKFYSLAYDNDPDNSELSYGFALACFETDRIDESCKVAELASIKFDDDPCFNFLLAQIYTMRGELDYAFDEMMAGLSIDPENAFAWWEALQMWIKDHRGEGKKLDESEESFIEIIRRMKEFLLMNRRKYNKFYAFRLLDATISYSFFKQTKRGLKIIDTIAAESPRTIMIAFDNDRYADLLSEKKIRDVIMAHSVNVMFSNKLHKFLESFGDENANQYYGDEES